MNAHEITPGVFAIHADIKSAARFEGIWPIPHGVTLNSYIVKGEKTALIDLAKDWSGSIEQYERQLETAGTSFEAIDYLILNHLEPDHTAFIVELRKRNPKAEILSTPKGIALVKNFFKIPEGLREVKTGDSLDLGAGRVLEFFETPNIHWPETMMTYDRAGGTLFSCDAFGSYGTLGDRVFDDEFTAEEHAFYEHESLRYYSNIVSSFSAFVTKALDKLKALEVKTVAPSHGIIWRKNPKTICDRYAKYAGYNTGTAPCEKEICIIWGSMYGYTKAGLEAVIAGIEAEKVPYTIHQVPDTDASFVLADAYKAAGLVIAMPTYEYKMFPPMAHILDLFERKHFTGKKALRIGSWGWVGGAKKEYEERIAAFKWTSVESVEWQGVASEADLALLKERGRELAKLVKE
ncbi:FprA family A-type flavoprotein [Treponema zuelzerae]|uniref:FprA family A-type flavoprotein n=1 Tax=Teretinema zuelzerae TaxID=156 RepID=A0AAE3JIL2_9SPIR|nr:FprA family A-type flavoprotein [Teretinema zuelzerae]MCD1655332.1 FprA family A-type flavoprotein [Teretinema zuelzerae]HPO03286.1 FprA family A-type flavoprotein [Treponemataceae bacterium]